MLNDEIELRKLNAIVGAALRGFVESGADNEFIGAFAASYREDVSKILGTSGEALGPPDLLDIVTQAVRAAVQGEVNHVQPEEEVRLRSLPPVVRRRKTTH